MALTAKQTKLIMRIGVMLMAALSIGLAVRLTLENAELEKLLPPTLTRTSLLTIGPLTSLGMLHLLLAVRTLGLRTLALEMSLMLGEAAVFIAIISPRLIGSWVNVAGKDCGRWLRTCPDDLVWVPLGSMQPVCFVVGAISIAGAMAYELRRT
jgi:hypothetical protein